MQVEGRLLNTTVEALLHERDLNDRKGEDDARHAGLMLALGFAGVGLQAMVLGIDSGVTMPDTRPEHQKPAETPAPQSSPFGKFLMSPVLAVIAISVEWCPLPRWWGAPEAGTQRDRAREDTVHTPGDGTLTHTDVPTPGNSTESPPPAETPSLPRKKSRSRQAYAFCRAHGGSRSRCLPLLERRDERRA